MSDEFDIPEIETTSGDGVLSISAWIHDQWFELDEVRYDRAAATCTVPIVAERAHERLGGLLVQSLPGDLVVADLVVRDVTTVEVDDAARVGSYSIDALHVTDGDELVVLEASPPCRIRFVVSSVHLALLPRAEVSRHEGP